MQGKKQYNEKLFVSFQLSQRVPTDNYYRRLKNALDLSFISKLTKQYYGSEGQKSIDSEVFFKLILVGYLENLSSDRQIIDHASMRLDIMFFLGYDIDEPLPCHSTLCRTRHLLGEEVFQSLFQQVLHMCVRKDMVSGKRQAIDSAYFKANASLDSLLEKEVIDDSKAYINELEANADQEHTVTKAKKRQVELHHQWQRTAYKNMPGTSKELPAEHQSEKNNKFRPKYLSNHTHYSPTDPDARISTKPGKPRQMNYTGQISVDMKGHVICGAMADFADKRDSQSLPQILAKTIDNLKPFNIKIEEIAADTGYSSGGALKALEFHNITGYIPNFGQYKPFREGFTYQPETDNYICSQGAILSFKKIHSDSKGNTKRTYRSSSKDCKHCPLRSTCIGKSNEKSIEDTIDKAYYDRMHARMQTPKARMMKKLRQSTVEPVLGTLLNFTAMRRVYSRGLDTANKHVIMACIAYNLKKYMIYKPGKIHSGILEANKRSIETIKQSINSFYRLIFIPHLKLSFS